MVTYSCMYLANFTMWIEKIIYFILKTLGLQSNVNNSDSFTYINKIVLFIHISFFLYFFIFYFWSP